jgi:hypothetical protein
MRSSSRVLNLGKFRVIEGNIPLGPVFIQKRKKVSQLVLVKTPARKILLILETEMIPGNGRNIPLAHAKIRRGEIVTQTSLAITRIDLEMTLGAGSLTTVDRGVNLLTNLVIINFLTVIEVETGKLFARSVGVEKIPVLEIEKISFPVIGIVAMLPKLTGAGALTDVKIFHAAQKTDLVIIRDRGEIRIIAKIPEVELTSVLEAEIAL